MGAEGSCFIKRLAELLSRKEDETYANVITWLRTRLSYEILKSVHLSIRGSRTPFKSYCNESTDDFGLNVSNAGL